MAPYVRIAGAPSAFPRWKARAPGSALTSATPVAALHRQGWHHLRGQPRPHAPWLQAIFLMSSSKKGISSHQLHRTLGCTLKTAWFIPIASVRLCARLGPPMGGDGDIIEADETFIGRIEGQPKARAGFGHKNVVLTLVRAAAKPVASTSIAPPLPISFRSCAPNQSRNHVMTDEANQYKNLRKIFRNIMTREPQGRRICSRRSHHQHR